MMVGQEHLFFESQGEQLFAAIYLPEKLRAREGYVICSPFAEEKKSSQGMMTDLARGMARKGFAVLLFDYLACGDSGGEFRDATLTSWIQNTRDAINLLKVKSDVEKVGLIGLRLGCFVALSALRKYREASTTILIEPVLDPKTYFKRTLRQKLMKELITDGKTISRRDALIQQLAKDTAIDFDGYEISSSFYADLQKQEDITAALNQQGVHSLIIHVTPTGKTSRSFQKIIDMASSNENLQFKEIQLDPFWERIDNPVYQPVIDEIINDPSNSPEGGGLGTAQIRLV